MLRGAFLSFHFGFQALAFSWISFAESGLINGLSTKSAGNQILAPSFPEGRRTSKKNNPAA
jgi:hypothetical protein